MILIILTRIVGENGRDDDERVVIDQKEVTDITFD